MDLGAAAPKFTGLVYDAAGRVNEVDGAGSLSKTTYTINADNRVTAENRYKTSTTFDTWSLLYDWLAGQTQVTDGDAKVTQSVRDDVDRLVKIVSPDMANSTVRVYDAASRLTTIVEVLGDRINQQTHNFTFDYLSRPLNADYQGICPTGTPQPEIQRTYDALPTGITCPTGVTCNNLSGRLAYVKAQLMCSSTYSATDGSLDQETFYSYDKAGRIVEEYIRDDSGRKADHLYSWTKNGALNQVTTPSGAILGWTYGSTGSNSDTDLIRDVWRTTSTGFVDAAAQWFPYGPLKQYNQQSTIGGTQLRTRITRNLAYRVTAVYDNEPITGGAANHSVTITEDAKGRVITRDYFPSDPTLAGLYDSYFLYDQQDRVTCETTTFQSTCPTTGTGIKNNQTGLFTNAGDWNNLLRPIAGSTGGLTNQFDPTGYGTSHQVTMVRQNDGTPALGDTSFAYDARGNRSYDDNTSTFTNDRRDYTYDARRNVVNVRGQYKTGGVWHYYDVASAFDARNRRVFKSFYDETSLKTASWYFYYDVLNRLSEVRYTPDTSVSATYSVFQLFWLGDRLTAYWQTDYPSVTTSKRYVGTDETGRPIDMWSWPASGDATRVWTINPSAWGFDMNLVGSTIYQPILFAGQYQDGETIAYENDGATIHRPGVTLNGFRTYDPFTGGYLQSDQLTDQTWSSYIYVHSNPVGRNDPSGLCIEGIDNCDPPKVLGLPLPDRGDLHGLCCEFFGPGLICGSCPSTGGNSGGGYSSPGKGLGDMPHPWYPDNPGEDHCPTGARCYEGGDDPLGGVVLGEASAEPYSCDRNADRCGCGCQSYNGLYDATNCASCKTDCLQKWCQVVGLHYVHCAWDGYETCINCDCNLFCRECNDQGCYPTGPNSTCH